MSATASHHHYNPDWLSDDDLVANFVARMEEFTFLRGELARAPIEGTVQHYLLVGLRGAGKTTLLKRLAVAIRRDADLNDHLIALSFPEELYQVKNLSDFWWAACDALADELDHLKLNEPAKRLDAAIEQTKNGNAPADAGLILLQKICAELKRRPVLLVDNLDLVFQRIDKSGRKLKDPHAAAYWELRETLSTASAPITIGGTVRLSEPFTDYDKAFYDFFIPKRLGKLALAEVRQVLEHLADVQGAPEVKQRLNERPSRIQALFELTGGNPRALGLIFDLLRNGPGSRAVEDFEKLMDLTTPYYKARFEDLSEQAQVVMHALAVRRPGDGNSLRFGHTAAELGAHAGLPTGTVSAQLDILEREGLVEKSAAHGRTQYRIAEQLFRLWLQMRSTRRIRQNVIDLTRFLEAMFDYEELQAHIGEESGASPLSDARLAFAVAGTSYSESSRKGLEAYGTDRLLQHLCEQGGAMGDYLPSSDMPEDQTEIAPMREQLQQCGGGGLTKDEQEALLGSLQLSSAQKQDSVRVLCSGATAQEEVARLRPILNAERLRLLRNGLLEVDIPLLFCKRTRCLLPLPRLTPQDAEAACTLAKNQPAIRAMIWRLIGARDWVKFASEEDAQSWLQWGLQHANEADSTEWANVAGAMRRSKRFSTAEQILEQAFKRGESARAGYERAVLLAETAADNEEVEAAFRKLIEINPEDGWAWNGLGLFLTKVLSRHNEAEAAYRKAIELNPLVALFWNNLGSLLDTWFNRRDEAEEFYRKAIELDPLFAFPWSNLGALLKDNPSRQDEAEVTFRKAVEIDPMCAVAWNDLGAFLGNNQRNQDEEETAFRQAIELDPAYSLPWLNLGILLESQDRLDEASAAFARGEELNPNLDQWWKEQRTNLQIRITTIAAKKAVEEGNMPALREALSLLLTQTEDIASVLVSTQFIEAFLTPLLSNKADSKTVLNTMREVGYEKYARPMLLAFEAAMTNRPDMLDELEPEIQGAAKHMHGRLIGKNSKEKLAP